MSIDQKRKFFAPVSASEPALAARMEFLLSNGHYREAAAIVRRLPQPVLKKVLTPILSRAKLVEAMPRSLPLLEAIYAQR